MYRGVYFSVWPSPPGAHPLLILNLIRGKYINKKKGGGGKNKNFKFNIHPWICMEIYLSFKIKASNIWKWSLYIYLYFLQLSAICIMSLNPIWNLSLGSGLVYLVHKTWWGAKEELDVHHMEKTQAQHTLQFLHTEKMFQQPKTNAKYFLCHSFIIYLC